MWKFREKLCFPQNFLGLSDKPKNSRRFIKELYPQHNPLEYPITRIQVWTTKNKNRMGDDITFKWFINKVLLSTILPFFLTGGWLLSASIVLSKFAASDTNFSTCWRGVMTFFLFVEMVLCWIKSLYIVFECFKWRFFCVYSFLTVFSNSRCLIFTLSVLIRLWESILLTTFVIKPLHKDKLGLSTSDAMKLFAKPCVQLFPGLVILVSIIKTSKL